MQTPMLRAKRRSLAGLTPVSALVAVILLAGCGSSGPRFPNVKPTENQAVATTTPATVSTSTTTTTASASGPPSFVLHTTTEQGDRVKMEGWFGPAQTQQESDVEASALSGCPPPANDGRAMVVNLETAITLESSLSGSVGFSTGNVPLSNMGQQFMAFVMGYSSGPTCVHGEPSATTIELHTMQPGETRHFTIWVVLPDAITPADPHPSEQALAHGRWLMMVPDPMVNGSYAAHGQQPSVSGPRVVHCVSSDAPEGSGVNYLAVVGHAPRKMEATACAEPQ